MNTYADILPKILETLKPFATKGGNIQETTELVSDLGLDSLQVMQILLKIEDHFDISIPLNNLPNIRTVKDLGQEVETLLKG